jgi:hypothetical protein
VVSAEGALPAEAVTACLVLTDAAGKPIGEVARAKIQMRTDLAFHRSSPAQILSALTESVAMGDWRRFLSVEDDDRMREA